MLEHIQTYWVTYACGILASVITGTYNIHQKATHKASKSGDAAATGDTRTSARPIVSKLRVLSAARMGE